MPRNRSFSAESGRFLSVLVLATAQLVPQALAQSKLEDRRAYLLPGTVTTDDPRRIPAPDVPKGPPGVLVLRGGRIFDSVKAQAYAGTLVIERNHIRAILPPGSADWPADA